jgi:hypothetical protein
LQREFTTAAVRNDVELRYAKWKNAVGRSLDWEV